jgi:hypothetical protein
MQFLFVLGFALVVALFVYGMGRRAGYERGRVDERKEWSAKIREIDKE